MRSCKNGYDDYWEPPTWAESFLDGLVETMVQGASQAELLAARMRQTVIGRPGE